MKRPDAAREMAHDFNNLLTAILGAADAVLARDKVDAETRADVESIRDAARRGSALARGDMDGDPAAHSVPVSAHVRGMAPLLAHVLASTALPGQADGASRRHDTAGPGHDAERITLLLQSDDTAGHIRIDPPRLDRVLLNLVLNARHAMPKGGTVTIRTAGRTVAEAEPGVPDTIPPGAYAVITVADTGTGIPKDRLARIFAPGFTTRRRSGGMGLGLASVHGLVRRSHGFLTVTSVEGRGARFDIHWPLHAVPPGLPVAVLMTVPVPVPMPMKVPAVQPPPGDGSAPMPRTVLLVEDEPVVRRITERMLQRAGWTVLCADSAETALVLLEGTACDLMISDVAMPGMDGIALTRAVRAERPGLPVVLTSGYADTVAEAGIVFLTKPYDQEALLAAMAAARAAIHPGD